MQNHIEWQTIFAGLFKKMDFWYGSVGRCQSLHLAYRHLDLHPPESRECDKVLLLVEDAERALVEVRVLKE
jgi:hypothetical protein